MRAKKIIKILLLILIVVIALALLVDIMIYPLKTTVFDLTGMDREEIVSVQIWHYGKTVVVEYAGKMQTILDSLEGEATRGQNDYFYNSNGGDWVIRFVDKDAVVSDAILLCQGWQNRGIKYGHYYYFFKDLDNDDFEAVLQIWEELNP